MCNWSIFDHLVPKLELIGQFLTSTQDVVPLTTNQTQDIVVVKIRPVLPIDTQPKV
jgi:hypothetical protein